MKKSTIHLLRWALLAYFLLLGFLVGGGIAKSLSGKPTGQLPPTATILHILMLK